MTVKWVSTAFGLLLDYEVPIGCNVVVLGVQKHEIVPVGVCLPHQVYREKIVKLLKEHDAKEIHIIPYHSSAVISLTEKEMFPEGTPALSSHDRGSENGT